jgi:hypothetical protein
MEKVSQEYQHRIKFYVVISVPSGSFALQSNGYHFISVDQVNLKKNCLIDIKIFLALKGSLADAVKGCNALNMSLLTIQNLSEIQTYQPTLKSSLIFVINYHRHLINCACVLIINQNMCDCNSGRQQAVKANIVASTGNFPGVQQASSLMRNILMTHKYGPLCRMGAK